MEKDRGIKENKEKEKGHCLTFFLEEGENIIYFTYKDEKDRIFYLCGLDKDTGMLRLFNGLPGDDGITVDKKGYVVIKK